MKTQNEWKSKADWKDPNWKYTPASQTDVSRTIARVRKEMKDIAEQQVRRVVNFKKSAK